MPSTLKYFISVFLFWCAHLAAAQDVPRKDFRPTGIRVGTDLLDLGKSFGKTFHGWELNGDVDFANYYLAVDLGEWGKDVTITNGNYSNSGNYFRVGIDANFLGNDPDKNMFFLGFRYGHAQFNEDLKYTPTSPLFTPPPTEVSNGHVTGSWAELTTGLRVKVWSGLWMGYTARMKFAPGTHGASANFAPYDMPGYGIVSQKPWWGFNYQVFWRFAWRKDKPVKK